MQARLYSVEMLPAEAGAAARGPGAKIKTSKSGAAARWQGSQGRMKSPGQTSRPEPAARPAGGRFQRASTRRASIHNGAAHDGRPLAAASLHLPGPPCVESADAAAFQTMLLLLCVRSRVE